MSNSRRRFPLWRSRGYMERSYAIRQQICRRSRTWRVLKDPEFRKWRPNQQKICKKIIRRLRKAFVGGWRCYANCNLEDHVLRNSFCAWLYAGPWRFLATREMTETLIPKPCQNHKKYLEHLKIQWRRLAKNSKKNGRGPETWKMESKSMQIP